jgi:hypothetical protein
VQSCGECFKLFTDWLDFVMCLPFRMDFQGAWEDKPDGRIPCFVEVYAPLFKNFSAASDYGMYYGVFQLVHKARHHPWRIVDDCSLTPRPPPPRCS